MAAVHLARALGVPSVVTLHGSDVNQDPMRSKRGLGHFQEVVLGADAVLAVSKALQDRTLQLTGRQPRHMPIGIQLSRFALSIDKAKARFQLGLPEGAWIPLFVGNLLSSKGVLVALEALDRLSIPDFLAVFVGEGPLGLRVESHPSAIWRRAVSNAEVATYMAAADVLILPSFSEGLPTVLVEAAAAGLPIIATRVGGIPELIEGNRGTLVESKSVEALLAGLLHIWNNPEEAQNAARRLKKYVEEFYNANHNAINLLAIYQNLTKHLSPCK